MLASASSRYGKTIASTATTEPMPPLPIADRSPAKMKRLAAENHATRKPKSAYTSAPKAATNVRLRLFRKFFGELDPFALRGELLIRLPVRTRVLRQTHF